MFHVVYNFGYHLFASQFPLIEQDALVFVLFKKLYTFILNPLHEIIPFACSTLLQANAWHWPFASKVFTYQVKVAGLVLVAASARHARLKGREKK